MAASSQATADASSLATTATTASGRVTQLVRDWESGNASFDRGALMRAVSSMSEQQGAAPAGLVDASVREWYYKWALFGPARRDAPDNFDSFCGTYAMKQGDPANGFQEDADRIAAALVNLPFTADSPSHTATTRQVRGLLEYMCTKTSSRYDAAHALQLLPLVQAAVDRQRAEGWADGAPSLRLTFLVWFMLRQSVGVFPATSNLRSYKELLGLLYEMVLQYHDPLLALHLAQTKADVASVVLQSWLPSLFVAAAGEDTRAPLMLIDGLIVGVDDALPALLPVALLIRRRDEIMAATVRADVDLALQRLRLTAADASTLVGFAKHLLARTPYSVRRSFREHLYTPIDAATLAALPERLARFRANVVLPVEADELMDAFTCASDDPMEGRPAHLNFVVLDCRAEKSFHHARLPTAVHVGNAIGFDPMLLKGMVTSFESARGSHLSIMGTGRGMVEELNLLKIIALQFVQAGFAHVSFADGGFKACVPRIKAGRAEVVRTPMAPPAPAGSDGAVPPLATSSSADGDGRKSGSRDNSVVPAAASTSSAAAPSKPLVSDETKEKLKAAQAKAADNFQAAKSWGLGLVSKLTAKLPVATSTTASEGTDVAATAAPAPAPAACSPQRPSIGSTAGDQITSPAPKHPSGQVRSPVAPAAAGSFHVVTDEDDDDFGIITSIPSVTPQKQVVAQPTEQPPQAPVVEEEHYRDVSVVSLQEVLARANSVTAAPVTEEPAAVAEAVVVTAAAGGVGALAGEEEDDDDFGIMTSTAPPPAAVATSPANPIERAPVATAPPQPAPVAAPPAAAPPVAAPPVAAPPVAAAPTVSATANTGDPAAHHPFDDIFQ